MLRSLLYLSIFSTVVVISWIAFSIHHNGTASTVATDTSTIIVPITPTFDVATIQDMERRTQIPVDLSAESPYGSPLPNQPERGSTSSATLTPAPDNESLPDEQEEIEVEDIEINTQDETPSPEATPTEETAENS